MTDYTARAFSSNSGTEILIAAHMLWTGECNRSAAIRQLIRAGAKVMGLDTLPRPNEQAAVIPVIPLGGQDE